MDYTKEENDLMKKFDKEFQKEREIVNVLNLLSETTYNNYYSKLEIKEDENIIIFELVENRIKLLEQSANERNNNFEEILAITVFKTLFMDKNCLKIKGLEGKKNYFNVVLNLLNNQKLNEKENKIIDDMLYEIKANQFALLNKIIDDYNGNHYYAYCFYLIYLSPQTKALLVDTFISFIKSIYKEEHEDMELEISKDKNFQIEELEKISMNILFDDLYNIYNDFENYIVLFIQNHHLLKKKMDPNEVENIIRKYKNKNIKNKNKKRNKKRKKNQEKNDQVTNHNNNINEIKLPEKTFEHQTNENVHNSKNKDASERQNKSKEIDNDQDKKNQYFEIKGIENFKEIKEANDISQGEISLKDIINQFASSISKLSEDNREYKKKIDALLDENEKFKIEINGLKKEISKNKNKHEKYKRIIKNMKSNIEEISNKSIKLDNELKLIQLRDSFKNIIDLFSKAFDISQDDSYINKITMIKSKLKQQKKLDAVRKEELCNFLEKIYFNMQFSNKNAHTIDLGKPILKQIFSYIDKKDKFQNLIIVLEKGKLNDLLRQLAVNRNENFNNKTLFIEEEEKIIYSIKGIKDILP